MRLRFVDRGRGQLADLKVLSGNLDGATPDQRADLVRITHSLAGAAGTFGFPEASRRASEVEVLLTAPQPADSAVIRHALGRLITELEEALS